MQNAINGAVGFLMKISADTNPIPYPLFKSSLERQIKWAADKGHQLDFDALAEAVKKELESNNVRVMPNKYAQKQQTNRRNWTPNDTNQSVTVPQLETLTISKYDNKSIVKFINWLYSVLNQSEAQKIQTICFTAELKKGDILF